MEFIPQITFRNLAPSDAVREDVLARIEQLTRFYDQFLSCRVVIELPHQHHHKGALYHVQIDLHVPGAELVINRSDDKNPEHEDVYIAIRDAFNAMTRRLQEHARRLRHEVKTHQNAYSDS